MVCKECVVWALARLLVSRQRWLLDQRQVFPLPLMSSWCIPMLWKGGVSQSYICVCVCVCVCFTGLILQLRVCGFTYKYLNPLTSSPTYITSSQPEYCCPYTY